MSYHQSMARGKNVPSEIAMPPLPPEPIVEQPVIQQAVEHQEQVQEYEPKSAEREEIVVAPQSQPPQETAQAKNFRELREKAEKAHREAQQAAKERDELARRIKELEQQTNKDPYSLAPDDLVEGKHLSHHASEVRQLKEELHQYKQQWHQSSVESRLRSRYSDFDSVVNQDTLSTLSPAIAQSLKVLASTDLEAAGEAAYEFLRTKVPAVQQEAKYAQDVKTAQANATKPRPATSLSPQHGETPLSQANAFANGLTPELQKQLLKEMKDAARKY